jgi:hypothetical protein
MNMTVPSSRLAIRHIASSERLGYKVVGELKGYVILGQSEILMRKTIGPLKGFKKFS